MAEHIIDALLPYGGPHGLKWLTVHVELDHYGHPEVVSVDGLGLRELKRRLEEDAERCSMREKGCEPQARPRCHICPETSWKINLAELLYAKRGSAQVMQALRHVIARQLEYLTERLREEARRELLVR